MSRASIFVLAASLALAAPADAGVRRSAMKRGPRFSLRVGLVAWTVAGVLVGKACLRYREKQIEHQRYLTAATAHEVADQMAAGLEFRRLTIRPGAHAGAVIPWADAVWASGQILPVPKDSYGQALELRHFIYPSGPGFMVLSAGPDKKWQTPDDIGFGSPYSIDSDHESLHILDGHERD